LKHLSNKVCYMPNCPSDLTTQGSLGLKAANFKICKTTTLCDR